MTPENDTEELSPEDIRTVNRLRGEINDFLADSDKSGKIYFPLPPWCLNSNANVQRKIIEIYEKDDWTVKFEYEEGIKYITFG